MSAIAWRKLPTTLGLASLRKPICVSLICTKVSAFFAATFGVSAFVAPRARGTPPATVQTTAAPLHAARQLNALRRAGLWPGSGRSDLLTSVSLSHRQDCLTPPYRQERELIPTLSSYCDSTSMPFLERASLLRSMQTG